MGWLWSGSNNANAQDDLDPSLREFLRREAPTGPRPALLIVPKEKPTEAARPAQEPRVDAQKPSVPPQSQFQDGRYAHLWKDYTPHDVLKERGKSEQDRLRDLVDAYNDRKSSVGRVAMENCALEYLEQYECFQHPKTWWSKGTMCNAESRRFNRCYDMQAKFLKALGYMTMDARTPEEDERIQMHADKLYQQMMQQEAEMEKAKEEGRPMPKFESVLSNRNVLQAMGGTSSTSTAQEGTNGPSRDYESEIWSQIRPESRKEYEKKLAALPPKEQEIERLAVLGELKAQTSVSKRVEEAFVEERIARMKRKEAGQATFGDAIKSWWGWG